MVASLRIYLSGSIRKGANDLRSSDHFWTREDEEFLRANIGGSVELLNPAKTDIRRQDFALNFGCDLYLVSISDVVLVDARREKGIGVGAEMMFAVQRGIPVITWAPPDTHYRRSKIPDLFGEDLHDWTHPFVFGLSDHVVDDLAEAVELIRSKTINNPVPRRKQVGALIQRYRHSIVRQGSKGAKRFVELGGGVFQDMVGGGAEEEIIAGVKRHRFMDVLFIPAPTDRIPSEAMVTINRWRERRLAERPLAHTARVRRIAAAVAGCLTERPRIFEIGCGKFPLVDDIPYEAWSGLETDREAVEYLVKRNLRAAGSVAELSDLDLQVDMAVALFCMQFAIEDEEISLFGRVPAHSVVMLNLPTRDVALATRRLAQLRSLGLSCAVLDLWSTGSKDLLVLAGRLEAGERLAAARAAALAQARAEWPSVKSRLEWAEPKATIAHRGKVR
jgi:hypothetical protein